MAWTGFGEERIEFNRCTALRRATLARVDAARAMALQQGITMAGAKGKARLARSRA
jgi:hypothetical protein